MNIFLRLLFSFLFIATGPLFSEVEKSKEVENPQAIPPSLFPSEEIPQDLKEEHFGKNLLQMLITLSIIVSMIFIMTWFLKKILNTRIQQLNTSSNIKILERRSLTPKTTIYLLEIEGKGFIVAESTNGLVSLSNFDVNASTTEVE